MTGGFTRQPLNFAPGNYVEVKDPCPLWDGFAWQLFGTAVTGPHRFEVLHASAPTLTGPWRLLPAANVEAIAGGCVAAPGVVAEGQALHMFLQTEYNKLDGRIEYLRSCDGGATFQHVNTALESLPPLGEGGIYDAHPARIREDRYLVYSAFSVVGQPDLHLARSTSNSWDGPWERLGPIVQHGHVETHNQKGAIDYEWGLEGAQLLELPDGRVLLTGVCFLPTGAPGSRQRVFYALAPEPMGPYDVLGPVLEPVGDGENGHATTVLDEGRLALFHQQRSGSSAPWSYALASMPVSALPLTALPGSALHAYSSAPIVARSTT